MNYKDTIAKYPQFEKYSTIYYPGLTNFFKLTKNLDDYYDYIKEHVNYLYPDEILNNKNISYKMLNLLTSNKVNRIKLELVKEVLVEKTAKQFIDYKIISKFKEDFRGAPLFKLFSNRLYDKNKLISMFHHQMVSDHWEKAATYKLSKENIIKFYKKLKIKNLRKNKHIDQTILDKLEIFK